MVKEKQGKNFSNSILKNLVLINVNPYKIKLALMLALGTIEIVFVTKNKAYDHSCYLSGK